MCYVWDVAKVYGRGRIGVERASTGVVELSEVRAFCCRATAGAATEVERSASGALLAGARNPLHLVTEHCAGRRPTEVGALGIPVSPLAKL